MSANSETRFFSRYQKLVAHLQTPLYRNGYLLLLGSMLTSGIGLVYWIIAARTYPTYTVGINTALISAMTFLAGIAQVNLMSALIRFIPSAGRSTRRFVLYSYLVGLVVSALVSLIFLKNLATWSPALKFMGEDPFLALWFTITTMAWVIFVLQDSVLTGLRQAAYVPLENTVFSLTKIALMLVLAVSLPALGIFASWSFALFVAVLPTSYYIFRKLIPQHMQQSDQANGHIDARQVVRFVATDYLGALFWIISIALMPVIVTNVAGATANAYYYLSWTIAHTLFLISPNMGSSLVVETANRQYKLGVYSLRIYKSIAKIVFPAAILVALAAPYILMVFGKSYSTEGAAVLRLLALTAIPNSLNSIFLSIARVQRRMTQILVTMGALCILLLGFSYVLLQTMGITGVGIGWLVSQSIVAVVVYFTQLHKLWNDTGEPTLAANLNLSWTGLRASLAHILVQLAAKLDIIPLLIPLRKKWSMRRRQRLASRLLPGIAAALAGELKSPAGEDWVIHSVANNDTNNTVVFWGPVDGPASIVLKLPGNSRELDSARIQRENLDALHADERLGDWRSLLPSVIAEGKVDGQVYFAEKALPGVPILRFVRSQADHKRLIDMAAEKIGTLHQRTASTAVGGVDLLEAWVDEPLSKLSHLGSNNPILKGCQPALDRLEIGLHVALAGCALSVSWIHGDYSLSNVLTDEQGRQVTGIVDWDLAKPNYLPQIDLMHLLLSARMETDQRELGRVVSDLLLDEGWTTREVGVIRASEKELPGSPVDMRTLLLLSWMHHIHANLNKTSRYDHHGLWVGENILPVLKAVGGLEEKLTE